MSSQNEDLQALRARYADDGFAFPLPVLSAAQASNYRRSIESIERRYADELEVDRYLKFDPHYVLPIIDELVHLPRLLDFVAAILGPDLMVSNTNLFLKEPHSPDHITFHQDASTTSGSTATLFSVCGWRSRRRRTRTAACSSCANRTSAPSPTEIPSASTTCSRGDSKSRRPPPPEIDPSRVVDVLLEPGQASIHHGWMAHASGPNQGNARRVGLVIRYMAPHLRQTVASHDYGILVRGEDRHHHFVSPRRPTGDFEPEAIEQYEAIREHRRNFLYADAQQTGS